MFTWINNCRFKKLECQIGTILELVMKMAVDVDKITADFNELVTNETAALTDIANKTADVSSGLDSVLQALADLKANQGSPEQQAKLEALDAAIQAQKDAHGAQAQSVSAALEAIKAKEIIS